MLNSYTAALKSYLQIVIRIKAQGRDLQDFSVGQVFNLMAQCSTCPKLRHMFGILDNNGPNFFGGNRSYGCKTGLYGFAVIR